MSALLGTALLTGVVWAERLPGPTYESPQEGSPGFAGFVATFLLAVAIIALAVSFTRRMRRATHRERERVAAETAASGPTDATAPVADAPADAAAPQDAGADDAADDRP
ncbi:hypothetical protein [Cellulomonas iranensis]|jgi:hypothetical protein|uniref:hypothetical protein n=1 Tax=Cellulomonas iranensis TaxID=76862 RepID=UPI000B3C8474|nr:hypothetical protein [Cellulomonas iranensis]UCN13920.1 hypothetical protein LFM56_13620 [Cellulomonas iranensis]